MAARRKQNNGSKEVDLSSMVTTGPQGAYEALQLFRSRAIRKKSKNDFPGSIATLVEGSLCLLRNGYENAGAELATLFLDFVNEAGKDLDIEMRQLISDIETAFPPKSSHRVEFLKGCVKWSLKSGNRELGDPNLHVALGSCLWDTAEAATAIRNSAVYHFAAGEAPEKYCHKIVDTYPEDAQQVARERALAQGVLHFLALENLRDANELMACYKKARKNRQTGTADSDLVTFIKYLLQTCRRDAQPLFKTLVNKYAGVLDFDETVGAMLTGPIGHIFFNIQPKSNPMMSMIQQMLA